MKRDGIQSACEKALRGWGLGRGLQRVGLGTQEAVSGMEPGRGEEAGQGWDQSEAELGRGLLTH